MFALVVPGKLLMIAANKIGLMKLLARILSNIPATCPFARDVTLAGHTLRIPPLCKLNPFFHQVIAVRFWAMQYLETH